MRYDLLSKTVAQRFKEQMMYLLVNLAKRYSTMRTLRPYCKICPVSGKIYKNLKEKTTAVFRKKQ